MAVDLVKTHPDGSLYITIAVSAERAVILPRKFFLYIMEVVELWNDRDMGNIFQLNNLEAWVSISWFIFTFMNYLQDWAIDIITLQPSNIQKETMTNIFKNLTKYILQVPPTATYLPPQATRALGTRPIIILVTDRCLIMIATMLNLLKF